MSHKDWHRGAAPVTVSVDCSGGMHTITWRAGRLRLNDHDVAAERALHALGGELCVCVEVLDAWRSGDHDRETLFSALVPRRGDSLLEDVLAEHRLTIAKLATRPRRGRAGRFGSAAKTQLQRELQRALLRNLPRPLRDVFVATVLVRTLRHGALPGRGVNVELADLVAAKAGPALLGSVEAWCIRTRGRPPLAECWPVDAHEEPVVCGLIDDAGGWVGVGLPQTWLLDVWARGLSTADGCFVLEASMVTSTLADVRAVRWERLNLIGATPVVQNALAFRASAGGWSLRWV